MHDQVDTERDEQENMIDPWYGRVSGIAYYHF